MQYKFVICDSQEVEFIGKIQIQIKNSYKKIKKRNEKTAKWTVNMINGKTLPLNLY